MEYVLYNGKCFAVLSETGKVVKSDLLRNAYKFECPKQAKNLQKKASKKLRGFFIYGIKENGNLFMVHKGKRIQFTREQRIEVYNRYDGYCNLCGRKLDFAEMTLDHIIPLGKGGTNHLENLQCSCEMCNSIKQNILPQDFMERISCIYLYQTKKSIGVYSLKWRIIKYLLKYPAKFQID